MNGTDSPREEILVCAIALLVACILAANQVTGGGVAAWVGSYAYWIPRIAIEAALFFMTLVAIEKYTPKRPSNLWVIILAIAVSLVPFTLAITSFDLIIGLPEPGLNNAGGQTSAGLLAFGKELFYLSDNHLSLCIILLLPRYLLKQQIADADNTGHSVSTASETTPSFLDTIDPPLNGRISWIEAQEHYVRIKTPLESRMVLHRFTDAVRELPATSGMQVHRSHWVCFEDIKALTRDGQRLKLLLSSGDYVPVSRSYRQLVEEKFQSLNGRVRC